MIYFENNKNLEDVPNQEAGLINTLSVTNSGTNTVNIYVSVAYEGTAPVEGVSLSTSYSGGYVGITDSILIKGGEDYAISAGVFDNSTVNVLTGFVELIDPSLDIGTYTSQVIECYDSNKVGNFLLYGNAPTNTGFNTYFRASNIEPIPLEEIYWKDSEKIELSTLNTVEFTAWGVTPYAICFDSLHMRVIVSRSNYLTLYDRDGTFLRNTGSSSKYDFDYKMRADVFGNFWGINDSNTLIKVDSDLNDVMEYEFFDEDSVYDFVPSTSNSGTFWYTNPQFNTLNYIDAEGDTVFEIDLGYPRALCADSAGGCWVIDNGYGKAYSYTTTGSRTKEVDLGDIRAVTAVGDGLGGFWFSTESDVKHISSSGRELVTLPIMFVDRILVGYKKVFLYSYRSECIKVIDYVTGDLIHIFKSEFKTYRNLPAIISLAYKDIRKNRSNTKTPLLYDPVWGDDRGTLEWNSISSGDILPKFKYYQFKVELSCSDSISTPYLHHLVITKGIRLPRILTNETRNFYLKVEPTEVLDESVYGFELNYIWKKIDD